MFLVEQVAVLATLQHLLQVMWLIAQFVQVDMLNQLLVMLIIALVALLPQLLIQSQS